MNYGTNKTEFTKNYTIVSVWKGVENKRILLMVHLHMEKISKLALCYRPYVKLD